MNNKLKILVADDSLTYRMTIQELLADNGYDITLAEDGFQALAQIQKTPPDLLILDVVMPHLDGVEVCKRIKADPAMRIIPIILLTSKDDSADKVEGLDAGAPDVLREKVGIREIWRL